MSETRIERDPVMVDIQESESKGIRASGYLKGKKYIILKGSHAVPDSSVTPSLAEKPKRVEKRNSLVSNGILVVDGSAYVFTQDVEFNSPSEAASIVWGSNLNGPKAFGLSDNSSSRAHTLYYEIDSAKAIEGHKIDRQLSDSSRNRTLIKQRKREDNYTCQACGYCLHIGEKAVIECHHLYPLALGTRETSIDDLVSLCPTCHRIAHMREPIYTVEEISDLVHCANK